MADLHLDREGMPQMVPPDRWHLVELMAESLIRYVLIWKAPDHMGRVLLKSILRRHQSDLSTARALIYPRQ